MIKQDLYVVFGTTGEYSGNRTWMVCAFLDESKAKEFEFTLNELIKPFNANIDDMYDMEFKRSCKEVMLPKDPDFVIDYTGTNYYIDRTELNP